MARLVGWVLIGALTLAAAPAQAQRLKLAVMPVQLDGSAKSVPRIIDEMLLTAVQGAGDYEVIGQDDISAMISYEQQKDLAGCDDASCLADLGGALGVDKIIVMKVAKLGDEWVTTSKLLDIVKARVDARSNYFVKGSVKQLLQDVPKIVAALFQNTSADSLATSGGATASPDGAATPTPTPTPEPAPEPLASLPSTPPPTVEKKPAATPAAKPSGPKGEAGVNLRFDFDALGPGWALGLGADVLTSGRIGFGFGLLFAWPVGVRAELRYFLQRGNRLRAYLGGGVTYFPVASLAVRPVVGVQLAFGPMRIGLDAGFEYYVVNDAMYESMALTLGGSAGVAF